MAFTLVELIMGLSITALVGVAALSLMTTTATGWSALADAEKTQATRQATGARLDHMLRNAAGVLQVRQNNAGTGNTRALIWLHDELHLGDAFPGDRVVQLGEIGLIQFQPADGRVVHLTPRLLQHPSMATPLTDEELANAETFTMIRNLADSELFNPIRTFAGETGGKVAQMKISYTPPMDVTGTPLLGYELVLADADGILQPPLKNTLSLPNAVAQVPALASVIEQLQEHGPLENGPRNTIAEELRDLFNDEDD
jgi:hypothetical protein